MSTQAKLAQGTQKTEIKNIKAITFFSFLTVCLSLPNLTVLTVSNHLTEMQTWRTQVLQFSSFTVFGAIFLNANFSCFSPEIPFSFFDFEPKHQKMLTFRGSKHPLNPQFCGIILCVWCNFVTHKSDEQKSPYFDPCFGGHGKKDTSVVMHWRWRYAQLKLNS